MVLNFNNLFRSESKNTKLSDFQDLDHLNGLALSITDAKLYNPSRDDLVLFYFRNGANYASVYTKSTIVSENIKWNKSIGNKKVMALLVNTRNANAFTGKAGYEGLKKIAEELSNQLNTKQKLDEEKPEKIKAKDIMFGCTGTIGETFPTEKIKNSISDIVEKIKYNQNKYIWTKAALGIMTTDLVPKLAMEECKIGNTSIKIYGVAKGSGMIYPNMATTLGYVFTDAKISQKVLKKLLSKNIETTFNAISCDGDTSTNDMVSVFATGAANNLIIKNIRDERAKIFEKSFHNVLLNLAKRVAADGEGASKFITISVNKAKDEKDAKKIAFSIANSPLVKTAVAGEDPNWGRIIMAIGKSKVSINLNKLNINFGDIKIVDKGQLLENYSEEDAKRYMRNEKIDFKINLNMGSKSFTVYTMDLTKKYIEINADYRS
ncbi:bifunctional glutamate N-acetyltransferase/amino-acid acetyltransferase ArgJ [Candidatus Pelagibacter communis]|uniref:bifunctional glutamate N-acetyltransferase/amino-acid acetyltransferase ArgJ n=1 Tax=Pelagibacter ubique TaxID=198252 RepID=UPI00094C9E27|nr:bifunctional glutamate N-acetyltransferase/amino-acid acetyltransferase ArgJ [Candidatus Pelagibacter ubique]